MPHFAYASEIDLEADVAVRQLEASGLAVRSHLDSSGQGWVIIARAIKPVGDHLLDCDEGSIVFSDHGTWTFRKWHWVPGPGPDDVDFEAGSLEEVVQAAINYYFGQPIMLQGWILPTHKHPEWSVNRLPIVIADAKRVSAADWETVRAPYTEQRRKLLPHFTTAEMFACVFYSVSHSENPNLILYLRRDLAEAFIVDRQG